MNADTPSTRELFLAALKLPAEAWPAHLTQACAGDAELRRRVEELLAAHLAAGSFLAPPTAPDRRTVVEPAIAPAPGTIIGHYKVRETIGEGGMGTVYLAEQMQPVQRKVALKLIKAGMDTRQIIARFEAERQALAIMDHPNIARVFDAGTTASGRPYFVMELVQGIPITEYCDRQHLTPQERLELFVTVCQAVQHAHQKGIIHRDIKPSNVLVSLHDDKPVVKVIDFGIAKATSGHLTEKSLHTGFAQLVGTPLYMSPEQAGQSGQDIDTRSDIYSLGVLLYELLTGTTPLGKERLKQAGYDEIRRVIREEDPPRPSSRLSASADSLPSIAAQRHTEPGRLTRLVKGDLDWIVMKALEKDRSRRYETANGFAADVLRYLADEPVTASPPSAMYRFRKFARRNRVALATGAVVSTALVTAVVILAVSNVRIAAERNAKDGALSEKKKALGDKEKALQEAQANFAEAKRQEGLAKDHERVATEQSSLARRRLYAAQMNLAMQAWRAGEVPRALELLEGQRPAPDEEDLRGFEWYHLWRLCHGGRRVPIRGHARGALAVAFSPDGKSLASAGWDGATRLWDTQTGRELMALRGHVRAPWVVVFSPDGRMLATGGQETETVILWDAKTGEPLHSMPGPSLGLAFSPDSRILAAASKGAEGEVDARLWDAESGEERTTFPGAGDVVGFLPDGQTFVTMTGRYNSGEIHFWDVANASRRLTIPVPGLITATLTVDGARLATCSFREPLALWACASGQKLDAHPKPPSARALAFSPDGRKIATGGEDKIATVWDLETGRMLAQDVHLDAVCSVAFSPDGMTLASSSLAGAISLWDMVPAEEANTIPNPEGATALRFSSDGSSLFVGGQGPAKTIDVASGSVTAAVPARGSWTASADARVIANLAYDGQAIVWERSAGREMARFSTGSANGVALSADGRTVATHQAWGNDNTVKLWDVATQRSTILRSEGPVGNRGSVQCATFSPDGRLLAAGFVFQWVTVWDVTTSAVKLQFSQQPEMMVVLSLAFSPDNRTLAVGTNGGAVTLWEVESGRRLATCKGHPSQVNALEFSPDGATLATAGTDRTVRLWDVITGQERCAFTGHQAPVQQIAFSADGRTLATAGSDATVKLWRTATDPAAVARRTIGSSDDPLYSAAQRYGNAAWILATTENPQERDPSRAVELALKATDLMPRSGQMWNTLGVAQHRAGRWQEAVASLDKSETLAPGRYSGWNGYYQAMAHWELGRKEEALIWYDRAAKWTDQHAPHHLSLCRLRIEVAALLGLPAPPASPILRPVDISRDNQLAELLRQRAALDERAVASPEEPGIRWQRAADYFRLAAALRDLDQLAEAEDACRQALARYEELAKDDTERGEFRHGAARTGMLLCEILQKSGWLEEAVPVCRDAIARLKSLARDLPDRQVHRDQFAAALMRLAQLLRGLDKPAEADEIERDAASTKLSATELLERARPAFEKGDWKTTAAELGAGFKLVPPDHCFAWFALAMARVLTDDTKGYEELAREMPNWFRERDPRPANFPFVITDVLRTCTLRRPGPGDPAELLRLARRACEIERSRWNVHNLAIAHYRNGQFELALRHIEEAQQIGDWHGTWPALAMTHHRLRHAETAYEWLEKAEELFLRLSDTRTGRLKALESDPYWEDFAYFEVMLREARSQIDGVQAEHLNRAHDLHKENRLSEAEDACRRALAGYEQAAEGDVENVHHRLGAGRAVDLLCRILQSSGRLEEAVTVSRAAIKRLQSVALDQPDRREWREQLIAASARLAQLLRASNKPDEAAEVERHAAALKLTWEELLERAKPSADKGDWKTAAAELGAGFALVPPGEGLSWFSLALARVLAEDVTGYEELARTMPATLGKRGPLSQYQLLDVIRVCTLRPQKAADSAGILRFARQACDIEQNNWNVHNLGVAHYRSGEYKLALERIEEARQMSDWHLFWPALAMTHHRLGQADAAREWLEKCEEQYRYQSDTGSGRLKSLDHDPFWQDYAYFEVMLREARELIDGKEGK